MCVVAHTGCSSFWSETGDGSRTLLCAQVGGCFFLVYGNVNLTGTTLDSCEAHIGSVFFVPPSTFGDGPLFIATMVTIWQRSCQGSVFEQQGAAQIVLRMVTFMPPLRCDSPTLDLPMAFGNVTTKGCGEVYTVPSLPDSTFGVCSSDTTDACEEQPVAGTALTALSCKCPPPQLVNPLIENVTLAPYVRVGGCVNPRELDRIYVERKKVVVALSKPDNTLEVVNATLIMKGNDWERPATWSIQNALAVSKYSPWLQLPIVGGDVAGADQLAFTLRLSASGLTERPAPYVVILQVCLPFCLSLCRVSQQYWHAVRCRSTCDRRSPQSLVRSCCTSLSLSRRGQALLPGVAIAPTSPPHNHRQPPSPPRPCHF